MEYFNMVLSALGGGTVVAVATFLFVKNKIEKLIDKKIDYYFESKLENKKGIIEQKVYVSQHKFDKEYEIIQELMEKAFNFTYLTWNVYSTIGYSDKDDSSAENVEKYTKECDEFTLFYMRNCAFITEDLAKIFDLFVKKINEFRVAAVKYKNLLSKASDKENEPLLILSDKMRTIHDEINTKSEYSHDKLVEITRKHYEKLDIK
ncbi:MAG: hypothetical protein V8R24_00940 [Dorea longicatena]|jgi:hypothetical protein|nr:hypothetical protein [uncultured Mediterraneibacter sp.]